MNDVFRPHRNDVIDRKRLDGPTFHREPEKQPGQRTPVRRRRGGRLFALAGSVLLAGGLMLGGWGDYSLKQEVKATARRERDFVPSLSVATVEANPATVSVSLPGTTAAFAAANIFARATGYIAKRTVDIGDRVKAGDLLAALAVPELDDQISQNEATLAQLKAVVQKAEANATLAQSTWDRDAPLVQKGWVTPHQGDIDLQTVKADEAAVSVAQANVTAQERLLKVLRQNRAYASVVAPFDGVITQRNVDVGALVHGNENTGTFMFEIMQKDVIRVWVYVPQDAAFGVTPGVDATVRVPELPDRQFPGKVTRIADALQSGTRTLLTEIDIPNPDGALPPGIYCSVELKVPRKAPSLLVPADAIIFNRKGMQVAVVNNGKAELHNIGLKRDLGTQVEVDNGVKAGDQVILNPPISLTDGSKVQVRLEAPHT
ncbi:efflux RND transporter periplasmic adaptor subunit [Bradyrhizobium genosp. A]|uniref:efflux RND transporter periplasmic adaptor subunit n=1 Tax=Bradyrhizobium genosp. A TaxID=83626 RepID=UPI003CF68D9F